MRNVLIGFAATSVLLLAATPLVLASAGVSTWVALVSSGLALVAALVVALTLLAVAPARRLEPAVADGPAGPTERDGRIALGVLV